jgi:endogenous inhibitor of DNA gyrase (YacG/DUF329 family)
MLTVMAFAPRCPTCQEPVVWEGNASRPFCSERCRLVDLAGWMAERYRVPGETVERDAPAGEKPDEDAAGGSGKSSGPS